jgi:hypothetical protein
MILGRWFEVHFAHIDRPIEVNDRLQANRLIGWRLVAQIRVVKSDASHRRGVTT